MGMMFVYYEVLIHCSCIKSNLIDSMLQSVLTLWLVLRRSRMT